MVFSEGLWEITEEDGTIHGDQNSSKGKIESFQRSHFPTEEYPKMLKREDGYLSLHKSETEIIRKFPDETFIFIS